jgi:hypothetical protein
MQPQSCGLRMHYNGALIAWADCGFDQYFHSTHRPVCFCSLALEARRNSSNQVWCVYPACSAAMCAAAPRSACELTADIFENDMLLSMSG